MFFFKYMLPNTLLDARDTMLMLLKIRHAFSDLNIFVAVFWPNYSRYEISKQTERKE